LLAYCKFLSANDTSKTGAHQSGIYIAKNAVPILFDAPGARGENKDKPVRIVWQDSVVTDSRFIYYGQRSRNEYRITRFGRGFELLQPNHTGDLFILVKNTDTEYSAYLLETEDDINAFLEAFALSPIDTGALIGTGHTSKELQLESAFEAFISSLTVDFPSSLEMSSAARNAFRSVHSDESRVIRDPDKEIIAWIDTEYRLFRRLELSRYGELIIKRFKSVDQFIEVANSVLNRRKSRAGRSLEHQLAALFDSNGLTYQSQPVTEGSKRPDFIFPIGCSYKDTLFPAEKLIFLGAKTTCKDRWRQVLNEADRIPTKHLFTLQQGISVQQLDEMQAHNITLVVPKPYLTSYPREKQDAIWTLARFIRYVRDKAEA